MFCSYANISPATLTHITSGRSKPTLSVLRGIVQGFPGLNPTWVLVGEGDMFREGYNAENVTGKVVNTGVVTDESTTLFDGEEGGPAESVLSDEVSAGHTDNPPKRQAIGQQNSLFQGQNAANTAVGAVSAPSLTLSKDSLEAAGIRCLDESGVADVVRSTVSMIQKQQRKVVEVRIFYDDGTYETFGLSQKH